MEMLLKAARLEKAEADASELELINRQTLRPLAAEPVDEVREFQQLGGGAFEIREQVRITDDLVKRRPLALRQDRHLVHGGSADTPGWVVDDPPQPQVI